MSSVYNIYKSLIYKSIKTKNRLRKRRARSVQQKYLFILSPPYSGSTLLHEILSTSTMISPNNIFDTREGQQLPELREKMFVKGRFETSFQVDWELAKKVWHKYWDPLAPILLDKSPANIVRARDIEQHFKPIYFLVLVRNPYAQCESLMRKNDWTAERSAKFAIQCLQHQKENLDQLQHTALLSYEDMTEDPEKINMAVAHLLTEVNDLHFDQKFKAHNLENQPLKPTNLNKLKIKLLRKDQIKELDKVFVLYQDLLDNFGYKLL